MDEFREKVDALESSLFGWFLILLLASIVLIAINIPVLANLSLWGCLLAFIIQKVVRVFDICFLMTDAPNINRLILVTLNIVLLGISIYIFWDLVSAYDFKAFLTDDLRERFFNFLRRLGF